MAPPHTILVVDDEADVVASIQDLLRLDFHVLGATRAHDGLRILNEQRVHVILSDQRMPGMSGVELLRRVREEHPEITRLLFTGYADLKAVIDAINLGNVYRYITKPWEPEELPSIVRQAAHQHDLLVERKRLLAELQAKNKELEKATRDLSRANEMKSNFIKVASHELRTPLTIFLGLTELALETLGLEEPWKGWLNRAHKAGYRLHDLVAQLTKMLMAEQFERPLRPQPTDLANLLKKAVEDVRPFIDQRHQEVILDLAPDLGTFSLERPKIRDCIDHLLLNAIKFTPDGGRIHLSAGRTADRGCQIKIADTGMGIDPDSLPHIFESFFTRLDVSRHSSGHFEFNRRGLGLGLSLVKAFVEMHGGRIDVASAHGLGTTFTITIPTQKTIMSE